MSTPPLSRSDSSSSLEKTPAEKHSPEKSEEKKQANGQPSLTTRGKTPTPFERTFNPSSKRPYGEFDDESNQEEQPPEKKFSKQDEQSSKEKSSQAKQSDTKSQGKPASTDKKGIVPLLKLPVLPNTARLTSRTPASPNSMGGLGSHRTFSPRKGDNSSSSSTPNPTGAVGHVSAPPNKPMPPIPSIPQTLPISTSNVPASTRSATAASNKESGMPASQLSLRSQQILDSALISGSIDPKELGNLLVEVQTKGFKLPTSVFDQGMPFLRAGLKVTGFTASDGQTYDSINLIEKFVQPLADKAFNTLECNQLRNTVMENYRNVASHVKPLAEGMRPKQMQESGSIKTTMDPVIKPFTTWVCGENENLTSSQLPEVWKSLLLGIDDAVVHWLKNINCTNMKDIKSFRSEAMIAFISTRGYMMVWGGVVQQYCNQHGIESKNINGFLNSYFAHRAEKFILDIMLRKNDVDGDEFDSKIRRYLSVLSGQKQLQNKGPAVNASGRRELLKSKTLQSSKVAPSRSHMDGDDASTALSPRAREKMELEKNRQLKQQQSLFERKKFFRDFSKLAKLSQISKEFFSAFQRHVETDMSEKAFDIFKTDPITTCKKYLDKFYKGSLSQERKKARDSIFIALEAIVPGDLAGLAAASAKQRNYAIPDSENIQNPRRKNVQTQSQVQNNEIPVERRKKFLGNFLFFTDIHQLSKDFLQSFGKHIVELSAAEYVKFESDPIIFCLAYVDEFYSSLIESSIKKDRERAAIQKSEFVYFLKNITPEGLDSLRKSMAETFEPASDVVNVSATPRTNVEFPANPFEEDEKQATNPPMLTNDTQPLQNSRTPLGTNANVNLVGKVESEKTENSSNESSEIATESGTDADDAASETEKTEES